MENLLEINNLIVAFENPGGDLTAVKGVSLSLDAHETLALVGESGCGKTVLCKSMLKILCEKGRIRQGEIMLGGRDLVQAGEAQMQRYRGGEIAMVFQDPMMSLDPAFSVGAQIAEVLQIHQGLDKRDARRRALELMQMVQIPEAGKRYGQRPSEFSGGMRQRIAIAVALAGEPKLLLADEPTTALDEEAQEAVLRLLKQIQRETGVAILLITHDLSLVEDVADRVAIMRDGVIVEEGTVADVFAAPSHDYTRKLLGFLDYKKGRGHRHGAHRTGDVQAKAGRLDRSAEMNRSDCQPVEMNRQNCQPVEINRLNCRGKDSQENDRSVCLEQIERSDCMAGIDCSNRLAKKSSQSDQLREFPLPTERALTEKPLLSVQHLCKSFKVGKSYRNIVFDDFNMDIYRGEIVGLVGRSGCGKSTLARCIMGIEPFESGIIEIGGVGKGSGAVSHGEGFDRAEVINRIGFHGGDFDRAKVVDGIGFHGGDSNGRKVFDVSGNLQAGRLAGVPKTNGAMGASFHAGMKPVAGINIQMIFQDSQSAFNDRMTIGEIIAEPLRIAAGKRNWLGRMMRKLIRKDAAMEDEDAAAQVMRTVGLCQDVAAQARDAAGIRQDAGQVMRLPEFHKSMVAQVMQAVELPAHMASRKPYELSGGQRQRAAIARTLITRPNFIIADEPLTGLDVSAQAQIVHLFKKLAVENDLTLLFIAHDLPMVNHISDRVIWMS